MTSPASLAGGPFPWLITTATNKKEVRTMADKLRVLDLFQRHWRIQPRP